MRQETTMLKGPYIVRNHTENRCACCDGKFGLIRYYSWRTPLCSKKCRDRFKASDENSLRWLRRLQAA
jgi:hypothetical protein